MENTNRPTTTTTTAAATGYPVYTSNRPNGYRPPPPPPPGAAYPYHAPPPQNPDPSYYYFNNNNNNNNNYYQQQQQLYPTNPRAEFLRRLIFSFIIASAAFFIVLFIIWLAIRPRFPAVHLTSLSLSSFNVSSQRVSGNWAANFTVYNPNKKLNVYYDEIESYVFYSSYSSESLAQTRIPPFKQGTKELTALSASYSALGTYVNGNVKGISGDLDRGVVSFDVRVLADVGFKAGSFRLRRRWLKVYCDNVVVNLKGNGGSSNLTGDGRQCRVWG